MSKKGIELRYTIDNLFCGEELLPSSEEKMEQMDCENLAQVIQHNAKKVYSFAAWTKDSSGCEYRSELLFPCYATLLYVMPDMISETESGIITEHRFELWITDNLELAVVSNYRTALYGGEFVSEYRTIKTTETDEFSEIFELDYDLLAWVLWALSEEFESSDMPIYEL